MICDLCDKNAEYPILVLGDFNMRPVSKGYKVLAGKLVDVNVATVNDQVRPVKRELIDSLVEGKYPSDHYGLYVSCNSLDDETKW